MAWEWPIRHEGLVWGELTTPEQLREDSWISEWRASDADSPIPLEDR